MTRAVLDRELLDLNNQIIHLGELVITALEQALSAFERKDQATCGLVIASDNFIDEVRTDVEKRAFRLLTLQQPLGGRDLRYLTACISIVSDLERAGDGAAGIAQMLLRMAPLYGDAMLNVHIEPVLDEQKRHQVVPTEAAVGNDLLALGEEALRVLRATMKAFADHDVQEARFIWQEDDVVDVRYHQLRHDLMSMLQGIHAIPALQQDSLVLQRLTYLLWMAHKLERIGDHCTNVCERIAFIEEGDARITPQERP